jgi:RimJ/RimL family protein N-acetyltransferase
VTDLLPTLRGERVALRQLRKADAEALFGVFSDPAVTRYWSSPPMTDPAEAHALLSEIDDLRWGEGLGTEAVSLLLDQAFGVMGLRRIEADTDPENESAMRLLERLGFRREGYLPQRWFVGGRWHDTVLFGLLKPDWRHDRRVENEGMRDA